MLCNMMNEFCERLVGEENANKLLFDPITRAAFQNKYSLVSGVDCEFGFHRRFIGGNSNIWRF